MAGLLPSTFLMCREPLCLPCLHAGKAICRSWRTKARSPTGGLKAGQCMADDQHRSLVPGLVAQFKEIPTKKRYTCATVFINLFSDFIFIHFQYMTNAQETLVAKHSFERYMKGHGVQVKLYHVDNGHFTENAWVDDEAFLGQSNQFTRVNAHFQNGRAEKKI